MKTVAIIIVNWNGREHLNTCLRSVYRQSFQELEVVIVDNGSRDGSVEFIQKNHPKIKLIQLPVNAGFAEANNIGVREVLKNENTQYIVTLNNDTETDEHWLAELVAVAEQDKEIGAVSSKMLFFSERTRFDSAGDYLLPGTLKVVTRGYKEEDRGQYDRDEECFSARAGAALYRREMLEYIRIVDDFFDASYFAYIEDTDLSIRGRLAGWKIMYAPKAVVYHKVAASTSKMSYAFRRYQSGRNRLWTAIKNYPISLWRLAMKGQESVDVGYRLSRWGEWWLRLRIIVSTIVALPRLLRWRRKIQKSCTIPRDEVERWPARFAIK